MKSFSLLGIFLLASAFLAVDVSLSYGGSVTVSPGGLAHFAVQIPENIRAGEDVTVGIHVYDINNNLISNFSETGRDLRVSVSGAARIEPSVLMAASFKGGGVRVTISDKKAETVVLSIYEINGTVPLYAKEVRINPDKLDHFVFQSPESSTAGRTFDVRITAKDAYDNTVANVSMSKDITIKPKGAADPKVVSTQDFRNGAGIISLMAEKTGRASIEAQDLVTGSRGSTQEINIMPSSLSHFSISLPKESQAGEPFNALITAIDAYNNVIHNYSGYGGGVNIISSGSANIKPSHIGPSEFRDGKASVMLTYEKAEEIALTFMEDKRSEKGISTPLKITPARAEHFAVITPDTAVAGRKFRIKVEAYDRFNNLVKDYNLKGTDVYLTSSGKGRLTPNIVSAPEFVEGVAVVDVSYDLAESFAITASTVPVKEAKEVKIKVEEPKTIEKEAVKEETAKKEITGQVREKKKEAAEKEDKAVKKAPKRKAEKKTAEKKLEKTFEIKDIAVVEAKEKALFVLNIPGITAALEFKDMLKTEGGKQWLKVSLKPALLKTDKPLVFKSKIIGEVKRETNGDLVELLIELLPQKAKYDIVRSKDSLVVKVTALQ